MFKNHQQHVWNPPATIRSPLSSSAPGSGCRSMSTINQHKYVTSVTSLTGTEIISHDAGSLDNTLKSSTKPKREGHNQKTKDERRTGKIGQMTTKKMTSIEELRKK
jgi:hypothetical protein